jgi:hypothetical protein
MAYLIYKSNGTSVTVPDNTIDVEFYNAAGGGGYGPGNVPQAGHGLGTQLIGRNTVDYGAAIAQNFLQLQENFSSSTVPSDVTSLQGQLWFKQNSTTAGDLYVRVTENTTGGILNWQQIPVVNSSGNVTATSFTADDFFGGTFHGVATSAQYADLAERYEADQEYLPGTVVSLGGDKEITATDSICTTDVFGVISTRPGMQLNALAGSDKTHPYVAQVGRVPVNVIGKVRKGQRLVSSNQLGIAIAVSTENLQSISPLSIIGRALENKNTDDIGKVLTAVGAR